MPLTASCHGSVVKGSKLLEATSGTMDQGFPGESSRLSHLPIKAKNIQNVFEKENVAYVFTSHMLLLQILSKRVASSCTTTAAPNLSPVPVQIEKFLFQIRTQRVRQNFACADFENRLVHPYGFPTCENTC